MLNPLLRTSLVLISASALTIHAAPVQFEAEVLPILKKNCVECHRAAYEKDGKTVKPKGELRFDAAWAILAGSKNGAVLVPGDADKSTLHVRVTLPEDDDDFMPPKGKADPLTPGEIDLLTRWINEGADFGEWEGNLEGKPATVSASSDGPPVSEVQKLYNRLSEGLTALEEKSWESVTTSGGRVMRLSQSSPLLAVDFRLAGPDAKDDDILSAKVIASHIAHLDLSRTSASDAAVSLVKETPALVRLDLSNTGIGDDALKQLKGLKNLRYLNLHATAVTDAGLAHLKEIKSLDAVYLWQSKVSEQGAKQLRSALPNAKINTK